MDGLELVLAIRHHDLDTPVVLITGAPSVETAIEAMDRGAMRYLVKPVSGAELTSVVEQAVNLYRMAAIKRRALDVLGGLDKQIGDRAGLEVKFESALAKLFMAYQPIVRWSSRTVAGFEALVRSNEPTIPHPGALFDAAERLGRLQDLNHRIRALAPLPFLDDTNHGWLFVNLHVRDLLDETIFDPESPLARIANRVVLEVTERAALEEVRDARARVIRLRELGFRVAIDDLGAGYAGLNSFAQLEPDVVKLDMTLVRDIHLSATKRKLVRSIAVLCRDMNMDVVAEGIETVEERDCVVDLGCDLLQGFLFARPGEPFPDIRW
jgi:EAL domain-containing protein (putative c-di-GMP-specific phosphodiesterase class I)